MHLDKLDSIIEHAEKSLDTRTLDGPLLMKSLDTFQGRRTTINESIDDEWRKRAALSKTPMRVKKIPGFNDEKKSVAFNQLIIKAESKFVSIHGESSDTQSEDLSHLKPQKVPVNKKQTRECTKS